MPYRLYQTRDGDMIDLVAWQHYGTSGYFTEAILELNRGDKALGLAHQPLVLPRDVPLVLPEVDQEPRRVVNLWD